MTKPVSKTPKVRPPARTPEAREKQLMAKAFDLAEKQLDDGTASSQVISHFLKAASSREYLEKEILKEKAKLMNAQTKAVQSAEKIEKLYIDAMKAMSTYAGSSKEEYDE